MDQSDILNILDVAAAVHTFPALDNGYIYLAATRLSLFRSQQHWALVFEVFGFSPRAGLPDLAVVTFGSQLRARNSAEKYGSEAAYLGYLRQHPYDDSRFFHPVEPGNWQDESDCELVAPDASELQLRGQTIEWCQDAIEDAGIELTEPPRIQTYELCRYLAAEHRSLVLASPAERRVSVPEELQELLVLDEWSHPDVVAGQRPSHVESFVQIAELLASGDLTRYAPGAPPNTHWGNWPEGGTL
jgi:hypothetical protein